MNLFNQTREQAQANKIGKCINKTGKLSAFDKLRLKMIQELNNN